MNLWGKEQQHVFTTLERGDFIAPTGGDERDEMDIAKLRRAMELLTPALLCTSLLPYVAGQLTLLPFIGSILAVLGCLRISSEDRWFKVAVIWSGLGAVAFCVVAGCSTDLLAVLKETWVNDLAVYTAMVIGALLPVMLTIGAWRHYPRLAPLMLAVAVIAIALPVLMLGGVQLVVRIILAVLATTALVLVFIRAKNVPLHP